METERDLVNRSKSEDGMIFGLIAYGKPFAEAVIASANEKDADARKALALAFEVEDKTGTTEISTVDGVKLLPWVLCVRSYWHGEVNTVYTADAELHKRIRDDRSTYREKREKAQKTAFEILGLTR